MKHWYIVIFFILLFSGFGLLATSSPLVLLHTHGTIAFEERNLMIIATALMLIVVLPVFLLLALFAWNYRASNTKAKYTPNWEHNWHEEAIWWSIPFAIVAVLAVITWKTSYTLDPYRPVASNVPPLKVQVVALDWKWLFIYPDQGIATVNYLELPQNTPVELDITADAPMNSLWIPQLSGQIYAMPGMSTQLHIIANDTGTYTGSSANFSGDGFSDMTFKVHTVSSTAFSEWAAGIRNASTTLGTLDWNTYTSLAKPSENVPQTSYASVTPELYSKIVNTYMASIQ